MILRRRKLQAGFHLEALEGRVVLSAAAHPVHEAVAAHATAAHVAPVHAAAHAAPVHATAHAAPAIPNPVLVDLTPSVGGVKITDVSYDARIHLITVTGTVAVTPLTDSPYYGYTPTYPTTTYVGLNLTQAVSKLQSVGGYQYSNATIADATVTSVPFTGKILASAGRFQSGLVEISVTSSSPYYYYGYNTYSVIAHMRNAKAY